MRRILTRRRAGMIDSFIAGGCLFGGLGVTTLPPVPAWYGKWLIAAGAILSFVVLYELFTNPRD